MSDRLYLQHLNIGRSGSDDEALGIPADAYLTIVPDSVAAGQIVERTLTVTRDEAKMLRDKLSEWLS